MTKCSTCTTCTATRNSTPAPSPTIFIHLRDAAARVGLKPGALAKRLRRFEQRPDGFAIRRAHGLVHTRDFERWIETLAKPSRSISARDYVRAGVRKMEGR